MAYEIQLSKKSSDLVRKKPVGEFYPSEESYLTLNDLYTLKTQTIVGSILKERVYAVFVEMFKSGNWKLVSTVKITCLDCDDITEVRDKEVLAVMGEKGVYCPYCGSDNIITEMVNAFQNQREFFMWSAQELGVTQRTILMRKEYYDRCERLGVNNKDAFAGIVTWGINWLQMVRQIEHSVIAESLSLEQAQNVLTSYDAIPDASTIKRYTQELRKVDTVECIAVPDSKDFVLQVTDVDGNVKHQVYYVAITDRESLATENYNSSFWNTDFGMMIARRLKIQAPITYEESLKFTPGYKFIQNALKFLSIIQPVRNILSFFYSKREQIYVDNLSKEVLRDNLNKQSRLGISASIYQIIDSVAYLLEPFQARAVIKRFLSGKEISDDTEEK